MNVEKLIREWAAKAVYNSIHCNNEEDVRDYLVTPFFELLGFTARDPRVFAPEYRIDAPLKRPGRTDLMLFVKGRPEVVVECKRLGRNLDDPNHWRQLADYARAVPDVTVGVLTNGVVFRFYTETDVSETLDKDPFMEIDLNAAQNGLNDAQIEFFNCFNEPAYDEGAIEQFASNELIRWRMIRWLSEELRKPSEEFCRLALRRQNITHVRDLNTYSELLKDAFAHGLASEIYGQIKNPRPRQAREHTASQAKRAAGVTTTPQELKIFEYVQQRVKHLARNQVEREAINYIAFVDNSKRFSIYYLRPQKGKICDYYQLNGQDKFLFPKEVSPHEVNGINNIDKPVMTVLRSRIEQSKAWKTTSMSGLG